MFKFQLIIMPKNILYPSNIPPQIISCILMILLVFSNSINAQYGKPTVVKVAKVQELMMAPIRKIPANVQAKFISIIKAESRGIVSHLVDVGSFIKQGEIIAELYDSQSKLREQELSDAIKSADARFQFLQFENSRLKDLMAKNLISKSELDKNWSDYLSAQSELAQAKSRRSQYQDQVTKLIVVAPFDGHVMQQYAQPGQLLNSGDNVIEFMQAGNLEIVVNVPFKYKSSIANNITWQVQTQNGNKSLATISKFIPAATGLSRTIEVHLSIADDTLWSGEAVNVLVPIQESKKVIAIPRDALVLRKDGAYVFIVKNNIAHKVTVITGIAQEDFIAVKGNLSVNDDVVIRGNERLRSEATVKVID
ncbi:MAG: efflux RND transporter periplasmic adaptor subunit [Proteobacteria bacterium]|nr:efflux RND transporter periplasmic adaptor subunit [Pseudomonadota bacterium]